MRWGLYDARSYDLPVERRYDTLWRRAVHDGRPDRHARPRARSSPTRRCRRFRLLSVTDIAQDPDDPRRPHARAAAAPTTGRDLRVYATPGALPRAGVVAPQRVVSRRRPPSWTRCSTPRFDGRRTVVTRAARCRGCRQRAAAAGPAGRARIVDLRARAAWSSTPPRAARPSWCSPTCTIPGWKVERRRQGRRPPPRRLPAARHEPAGRAATAWSSATSRCRSGPAGSSA